LPGTSKTSPDALHPAADSSIRFCDFSFDRLNAIHPINEKVDGFCKGVNGKPTFRVGFGMGFVCTEDWTRFASPSGSSAAFAFVARGDADAGQRLRATLQMIRTVCSALVSLRHRSLYTPAHVYAHLVYVIPANGQ
jgi:hypothetical protein